MLSLFPSLFDYSFFGITFLRVVLALVIAWCAWEKPKEQWPMKLVQGIIAVLLLIGLFTQAAALLLAIIATANLIMKKENRNNRDWVTSRVLIIALALALVLFGPGAWAIDLPL